MCKIADRNPFLGNKVTCDCQDSLHTFASNRIVDHTEILSRILDFSLFDDQGTSNLFNTVVQVNQFLIFGRLHKLVPSKIRIVLVYMKSFY